MGCLKGLVKLLVVALLAAAVALGWHWRHEFRAMWEFWRGGHTEVAPASGLASPAALAAAKDKVDSLNGWRADSVQLDAAQLAALLADGFGPILQKHLDSVHVTLGTGRVEVTGRLDTGVIPKAALGPLAGLLRQREWVRVGGDVRVLGPHHAEWQVDGLRIRGVRLPGSMVQRLVQASLGGGADGAVPVALPTGVRALRITPTAVTIYGGGR